MSRVNIVVFLILLLLLPVGLRASTLFCLLIIPIAYYLIYSRRPDHGLPERFRTAAPAPSEPESGPKA